MVPATIILPHHTLREKHLHPLLKEKRLYLPARLVFQNQPLLYLKPWRR
jgi:hypothetical protein